MYKSCQIDRKNHLLVVWMVKLINVKKMKLCFKRWDCNSKNASH